MASIYKQTKAILAKHGIRSTTMATNEAPRPATADGDEEEIIIVDDAIRPGLQSTPISAPLAARAVDVHDVRVGAEIKAIKGTVIGCLPSYVTSGSEVEVTRCYLQSMQASSASGPDGVIQVRNGNVMVPACAIVLSFRSSI